VSGGATPGPWLLDGSTVYALDESGSCNRFSVRPEGGWTFRSSGAVGASGDRTTEAELEANARLIAAAPELLEALEGLVTMIGPKDCRIYRTDPCTQRAVAAIAKARGAA
jgi:hypothetical protein